MHLPKILLAVICLLCFSCTSEKKTDASQPDTAAVPEAVAAAPAATTTTVTATPIFTSKNIGIKAITELPEYRDSLSYAIGSYLSSSYARQELNIIPGRMTQGYLDVIKDEAGLSKRTVENYLIKVKNIQNYRLSDKSRKIVFPLNMDSVSYAVGADLGYQQKGTDFEMHAAAFQQGLVDGIENNVTKMSESRLTAFMGKFFNGMTQIFDARKKREEQVDRTKEIEIFNKNKTKKGMVILPSGLQYEIVKKGTGSKIGYNDKLMVRYEGRLLDGTVFESNLDAEDPVEMIVNKTIPGLVEGLQMIKKGGKYTFFVPSKLGYAEEERHPKIPLNAALIYEIEVIDVLSR